MFQTEVFFDCPYCAAHISMLVDQSVEQEYIEDCEVCCKPISIRYAIEDGEICNFKATRTDE